MAASRIDSDSKEWDSAYHVWVNGKEVGYGQGSRNASEFDISDVVRGGERQRNTLRVKVYQWSDGSYIEDQDMWWLSGSYDAARYTRNILADGRQAYFVMYRCWLFPRRAMSKTSLSVHSLMTITKMQH